MDSVGDTACAVGCPIRRSRDQRLLASPPGLSQRATSFIASQCQGIHQMPLITRLSTTPNGKDQTALWAVLPRRRCGKLLSLEDTCWDTTSRLLFTSCDAITGMPDVPSSVTLHTRYSPIQSAKRNGSVITSVANSELLTEFLQTPRPLAAPPEMVEVNGIEPMTSCLQSRRSPN
jgi:hypothetical protein